MTAVSLRITGAPNEASLNRVKIGGKVANGELVVGSMLPPEATLNEHLVWLWGQLKHGRRYLKSLQAEGATLTVHAKVKRGPITIEPNGSEFLHLIGATLKVEES